MSFLTDIYNKSIQENERNLRFWEDYLQELKSMDFGAYSDKLRVPVLVPIGSRICFRGDIKHTNEVTVSLGADYFAKCSIKQVEVLRQHRIKNAQNKVDLYLKEKDYLENQVSLSKQSLFEQEGQEIVEVYTEEEDEAWRKKHKENMRKYKQASKNDEQKDVTDEELWQRLEELELQEELENELQEMNNNEDLDSSGSNESFIIKEDEEIIAKQTERDNKLLSSIDNKSSDLINRTIERNRELSIGAPSQTSKLDLLQQVIDRQNELENRLLELKNRERSQTKTERDLLSRLDEIDQLGDIEDEMDRLDDVLENEDMQELEDQKTFQATTVKRQVTFADDDDSETLELTFKHSDVQPDKSHYDPAKGIQKPSDIFEAFPNSFSGSTSILKKSKYEINESLETKIAKPVSNKKNTMQESQKQNIEPEELENQDPNETIVIKDVIERLGQTGNKLENEARPTSLFKKKRMQKK
ncbi:hypothetical protein O3G_MSEX008960 [Manduca sexta]|uniref:Unconventional prefoldin RPB5 interactor n=1 Tax=Manduca sexta TaxID=7130 RepID=A0A921ZDI2_MANSE|nr:hypothetical protein O3G_MSEX008960 [Manduca sexta]